MKSPAGERSRILIIKPSSLGDVIHALPVLADLRRAWPRAHVAWLIATPLAPLLADHPLIDELISFDRAHFGRLWRSPRALRDFVAFVRGLRARRFDAVLDLQGLLRSGLFARLSGAPRRIGPADARERLTAAFYTERVSPDPGATHAVERNRAIGRALLGRPRAPNDPPRFPLPISDVERSTARALVESAAGAPVEHYFAVAPGARWPSKVWRMDRLAAVCEALTRAGRGPAVLIGAPADRALAAELLRNATMPPIDLIGRTTVREMTALIAAADFLICPDSGPMHVAAALGRPTIALFGPTDPARTGPWSPRATVVRVPLECSPCLRRVCPLGHHACMERIAVETIVEAAGRIRPQGSDRISEPRP